MTLVMALSLLPAAAMAEEGESVSSAAVTYTVQGRVLLWLRRRSARRFRQIWLNLYGYSDSVTDGVSTLDVLVAAHQTVFGGDFTPDT